MSGFIHQSRRHFFTNSHSNIPDTSQQSVGPVAHFSCKCCGNNFVSFHVAALSKPLVCNNCHRNVWATEAIRTHSTLNSKKTQKSCITTSFIN